MKLEKGKTYKMRWPNNEVTVAKLVEIINYSATGMLDDYIFKYISGNDTAVKASPTPNLFPLPVLLLKHLVMEEA